MFLVFMGLEVSSRISRSFFDYLDEKNFDFKTDLNLFAPVEFYFNPYFWHSVEDMESLLFHLSDVYKGEEDFFDEAARKSFYTDFGGKKLISILSLAFSSEFLFSDLKIMQSFIKDFEFQKVKESKDEFFYHLSSDLNDYPCVKNFLTCFLKKLPLCFNEDEAEVFWDEKKLKISWKQRQRNLFKKDKDSQSLLEPFFKLASYGQMDFFKKEKQGKRKEEELLKSMEKKILRLKSMISHSEPYLLKASTPLEDLSLKFQESKKLKQELEELNMEFKRLQIYLKNPEASYEPDYRKH